MAAEINTFNGLMTAVVKSASSKTKWDFLDDMTRTRLTGTTCDLRCSGCNTHMPTEADFAKHFVVLDVHHLDVGYCPDKD